VILGPDGPSLGGFVCPATIAMAELWKIGQLRPGDRVHFRAISDAEADALRRAQDAEIAGFSGSTDLFLSPLEGQTDSAGLVPAEPRGGYLSGKDQSGGRTPLPIPSPQGGRESRGAATFANAIALLKGGSEENRGNPILAELPTEGDRPRVLYRRAGDDNILVEYGPLALDISLRMRVQALLQRLTSMRPDWAIDLTPGIRSLQVHFDPGHIKTSAVLDLLQGIEADLPPLDDMDVPSRIVHMPLSWDDEATRLAIRKYMQSVRPDAPWCPSNIEFIRRINGLDSIDEVKRIVFDAHYLVLGLGDVYLGAPVATPLDPRHRLVTTKYNPARTWTPENAVGIGGAYLCVYGMEGPGGYQFVGRTCQVWNTYRSTAEFEPGKPWLLRFFDQIRFHEVSHDELTAFREDFLHGRVGLDIEPSTFRLAEYRRFLAENEPGIAAFKAGQQAAFEAERARWAAAGQAEFVDEADIVEEPAGDLQPGAAGVTSPVPGSVWKVDVQPGAAVSAGDVLLVVESMKMEISVTAPCDGTVAEIRTGEGRAVALGQILVVIELVRSAA
jgi:urea carboxylase